MTLRARGAGLLAAPALLALLLSATVAEAQTLSSICGSPFTFASPPAGFASQVLLLSPDEQHLFAAAPFENSITVLDVATSGALSFRGNFPSTPSFFTSGMAINPEGTRLYVTTFDAGLVNVQAIDATAALTQIQSAFVGTDSAALNGIEYVRETGGDFVYVNNDVFPTNTVSAFPVDSNGLLGTPIVYTTGGAGAGGGFFGSPTLRSSAVTGERLFVANGASDDISVFDIATDGTLTLVPNAPFPIGAPTTRAIAVAGGFVYAGTQANSIAQLAIDSTTGALTAVAGSPFPTGTQGGAVDGLTASPDGSFVVATIPNSQQVSVLQTSGMTLAPFSPRLGDPGPTGVIFDQAGTRVFVAAAGGIPSTTVSVYDFGTFSPLALGATVESRGSVDPKTGFATVSGTVTRSVQTPVSVQVFLFQKVGRTTIVSGSGFATLPCGSGTAPWSVQITGSAFGGGEAFATVTTNAIDPVTGQLDQSNLNNVQVHLSGGR
jgi:DNA-binding beta-propeller fold protein YncE